MVDRLSQVFLYSTDQKAALKASPEVETHWFGLVWMEEAETGSFSPIHLSFESIIPQRRLDCHILAQEA